MSILKKLTRQGDLLVHRDLRTGQVVHDRKTGTVAAVIDPVRPETWRQGLAKLTNNGADLFVNLKNLADGVPIIRTLPDGRVSEPVLPSPEVMRASNVDLIQFLHGRAVPQNEVSLAEKDARAQLDSLSDEELRKYVDGEVVSRRELPPEEEK
jgi:hypothetical protein